jgi:hypothetical protein
MAYMKVNVSHFAGSDETPVGAAARCDLLILIFKNTIKDRSLVALDSVCRILRPGRSNTIHERRPHCLPIDGRHPLPMMEITGFP